MRIVRQILPLRTVIMAAALVLAMLPSDLRAAETGATCKPFPAAGYLSPHSHERIVRLVNTAYRGQWEKFTNRLEAQLTTLRGRLADGRSARLRKGSVVRTYRGETLADYIRLSEIRLDIVRCLEQSVQPVNLADFVTAAGGEALSHKRSSGLGERIKLSAKAFCRGQNLELKVKNVGGDWPKTSKFNVYRIDSGEVRIIASRPMRMKANQVATFRVSKQRMQGRQIGLFVAPSWYQRPFAFDLDARCSVKAASNG